MIHISQYITQEETERIRSDHQYFIDKCKEEYRITEEDDKHVLSSFLKEQIKSIQKKIRKTVIDREADRLLHQLYPNTSPSKKQRNKVHKRVCSSAEIKSIMQKEIAVNKEIAHYNKLLLRMDISEFNNADVAAFRSYKDNILNRLQAKIDHPYDESHSVLGLNYFEDVFTRAIKTFFDDKENEIMEKALSLCEKFLREEVCPDDLIEIIVDRYIPFERSEITDDNAYDYIMQELRNGQFYLEEILKLALGREKG